MGDAVLVAVADGNDNLLEILASDILGEAFALDNSIKEFTASDEFEDDVDMSCSLKDLFHRDDEAMAQLLQDRNFALQLFFEMFLGKLRLVDDLDSKDFFCCSIDAFTDFREGASSEDSSEFIFSHSTGAASFSATATTASLGRRCRLSHIFLMIFFVKMKRKSKEKEYFCFFGGCKGKYKIFIFDIFPGFLFVACC